MKDNNKNIDETIYKICSVINGICKLNVEFIGTNENSSFQLVNCKTPSLLIDSKINTFKYIHDTLKIKQTIELLHHTDNFELSYFSVGFFDELEYKGTIIVGPFLCVLPDDEFISMTIQKNNFSISNRIQLQEYYRSLPIFDFNDNTNTGTLLMNLASKPLISGDIVYSHSESINTNKNEMDPLKEEELASEVELRYKIEKGLFNAVQKGLKEEALKIESLFQFNISHRVPNNPLRAHKNLLFSINTLLRLASEQGGVAPFYLHSLSDKFATLIENLSSMTQLFAFITTMISEYCDLVNKYSTIGYSSVIKNAITYINLNFENQISLNIIAENVNINPSHLSRQFKKETGVTVTEFINKKRINEAKFLIEQNNSSITEIALMVGFENHNYFCKVFKQITSVTPKEYLKKTYLKQKE